MKKLFSVFLFSMVLLTIVFSNPSKEEQDSNSLTLYSYDTFCGDWGSSATLIPLFEEKTGLTVNVVSCGSSAEMINKLLREGENTSCDVVFGVSDDLAMRLYSMLSPYNSKYISDIDSRLIFDKENRLIPFDWGIFSFVWDTESNIEPPKSLWDLTKEEYKKKVILIDPRTSSVGYGLLLWTYNVLGNEWLDWWRIMKENALVFASGWSTAYGLFTEGEAPIVISYTTSPVYHVENENTTRYQALIFEEGHEATVEGMGIIKYSKNRENAERFIDFILTDGQLELALTNSMYPSVQSTTLPSSYLYAPQPEKIFTLSEEKGTSLLALWTEEIGK